jgi:hypothetical protein
MKELEISSEIFPPKKCPSKDDSSNLSTVGLYIIQKLREEDLKEMLPSLSLDESNLNLENVAEELNSKYGIVELILNNRDILVNLDEFYEEECQLSLLNWAWNIHRKFFGRKNETNSTGNNLETDTNANIFLNKEFLFKNKCLNNKAEILLFNILNIFEIFPIKPDDLKSLNFIEKLKEIKKDMKSKNLILYKKIKKLIKFWKKMIKFFDSRKTPDQIPDKETEIKSHNPFNLTLNQKRKLENCSTTKKEKNINLLLNKDDSENMSSNLSIEETESGEHKIKKKNVTWKNMESLVEKIEYDPMNAPFEI